MEKEKDAPNISLPLHMPRDLIPDWASLAGRLAMDTFEVTDPGMLGMELIGSRSDRCGDKV